MMGDWIIPRMEESSHYKQEDELELTRVEMSQARRENQRLKHLLEQVEGDYRCLRQRLSKFLQQKDDGDSPKLSHPEATMVSLRLGMSSIDEVELQPTSHVEEPKGALNLGKDSPKLCLGESKVEETNEKRTLKRNKPEDVSQGDQVHVKRARVCVRARCDTPTMNDGCQWRKYGQKISKGNPCPRSYYRCTVAPTCPVRKQVQRCADDMTILITTYDGIHNHSLPTAGSSIASTTSAAASMLLSGSAASNKGIESRSSSENHGLQFSLSDTGQRQVFFPFPATPVPSTVTLDLTTGFSTSTGLNSGMKISSGNLSFGPSESSIVPSLWGLNYEENLYQGYMKLGKNQSSGCSQHKLTETLTNAITLDPSFSTAIASAITSMIGSSGRVKQEDVDAEVVIQNLIKCNEMTTSSHVINGGVCSTALPLLRGVPFAAPQTPTLTQSALPFSIFNSFSNSNNQNLKG